MNKTLNWQWNLVKIAVLIFPIIPELGGLGLLVAAVGICRQKYLPIIQYPLNWGIALLSIWLIFTSFLAEYKGDAFLGLANFLPFFFLFVTLSQIIETPSQLRQLAWRLVIPSVPIVILGLGQLFLGWGNPQFLQSILPFPLVPYGEPTGRMSSIFMYANLLGAYLLVVLILALGLWLDTYQSWRLRRDKWGLFRFVFLSLTVLGDGIGLILTNSRNAWGLAGLAFLFFTVYLGWVILLPIFGGIIGIILGASWAPSPIREWFRLIVPAYFWARISDDLYPNRPVETLRITQWKFAGNLLLKRPLNGWGLRNFSPLYQSQMGLWLGHPHNLFLMLLAETGTVGTLLICAVVAVVLFRCVKLLIISTDVYPQGKQNRLILFTYLLAFSSCALFNCFDVTILDGKLNTVNWLILSAISGVVYRALHEENSLNNI